MRLFDSVLHILQDIKEESEIISAKKRPAFKVSIARHPTMGKVVIVEGKRGDGIIVKREE